MTPRDATHGGLASAKLPVLWGPPNLPTWSILHLWGTYKYFLLHTSYTEIHVLELYLILYLAASQVCIASSWFMEQELYLEALIRHWKLGRTWYANLAYISAVGCLFVLLLLLDGGLGSIT